MLSNSSIERWCDKSSASMCASAAPNKKHISKGNHTMESGLWCSTLKPALSRARHLWTHFLAWQARSLKGPIKVGCTTVYIIHVFTQICEPRSRAQALCWGLVSLQIFLSCRPSCMQSSTNLLIHLFVVLVLCCVCTCLSLMSSMPGIALSG